MVFRFVFRLSRRAPARARRLARPPARPAAPPGRVSPPVVPGPFAAPGPIAALVALGVATVAVATLAPGPASGTVVASTPERASAAAPGSWSLPVDGGVVDPFREPAGPYGPGHRGVSLDAPAGTVVRAAGDGTVVFAGQVGGTLHVVVAHAGDLRTSYSYLSRIDVSVGQVVTRGTPVGLSGGPGAPVGTLHFGLRVGDRYVDPMLLFRPVDLTKVVHLTPVDEPPQAGVGPYREAAALARGLDLPAPSLRSVVGGVLPEEPSLWDRVVSGAQDALGTAGRVAGAVVRTAAPFAADAASDVGTIGERLVAWAEASGDCTSRAPALSAPGGSGHLVMAVAGISSASDATGRAFPLDTAALGYHDNEVRWYSYADDGGPYAKPDTWRGVTRAALGLADQLRAYAAENPGREVDLVAHSQGGLVVDVFLQYLYDPADPTLPPMGTVVTLASPHEGAPLASASVAVRREVAGALALVVAERASRGALPPSASASMKDLDEASDIVRGVRGALPEHMDVTSIGGVDDLIVPADHTDVPGGHSVTVNPRGPNDHTGIVSSTASLVAARLALEGKPPPCVGFWDGVRGAIEPVVISRLEHTVGTGLSGLARAATEVRP